MSDDTEKDDPTTTIAGSVFRDMGDEEGCIIAVRTEDGRAWVINESNREIYVYLDNRQQPSFVFDAPHTPSIRVGPNSCFVGEFPKFTLRADIGPGEEE